MIRRGFESTHLEGQTGKDDPVGFGGREVAGYSIGSSSLGHPDECGADHLPDKGDTVEEHEHWGQRGQVKRTISDGEGFEPNKSGERVVDPNAVKQTQLDGSDEAVGSLWSG